MYAMVNIIQKFWLQLTLLILLIIAILSLWPATHLPNVPGSDKTHHIIGYTALIFPAALTKPKNHLFFFIGFLLFSGVIEIIQPYVNRYGEWLDMLANAVGLVFGVILAQIVQYFSHKSA